MNILNQHGIFSPYGLILGKYKKHEDAEAYLDNVLETKYTYKTLVTPAMARMGAVSKITKLYEIIHNFRGTGETYIRLPRTTLSSFPRNTIVNEFRDAEQHNLGPYLMDYIGVQGEVVKHLSAIYGSPDICSAGAASIVLNLPAGLGKTFVAGKVWTLISSKPKCIYVTFNELAQTQAVKDFKKMFGENIRISTDIKQHQNIDILILIINSAVKLGAEIISTFGFMIIDEIHKYSTKVFGTIYKKLPLCVLGISASTETKSGDDKVFKTEVGRVIKLDNIIGDDGLNSGVIFDITVDVIDYTYSNAARITRAATSKSDGRDIMACEKMFIQMLEDKTRNNIAVEWIADLFRADKCGNTYDHACFVFAEHHKPLELFGAYINSLPAGHILKSKKIVYLSPKNNDLVAAANADIILTTYAYCNTGISFPRFTAAFFLTPRMAGLDQSLGRITRISGDISIPRRVGEICDRYYTGQSETRIKDYEIIRKNTKNNIKINIL